jgi:hypothetical protein
MAKPHGDSDPTDRYHVTMTVKDIEYLDSMLRGQTAATVSRTLLLERLELEKRGWRIGDRGMLAILGAILTFTDREMENLQQVVRELAESRIQLSEIRSFVAQRSKRKNFGQHG